jgi:hypothetical protein
MFDASNRQTCKVRQSTTNTPLHALTTLNDVTWAEAARVLAGRAMEAAPDTGTRLNYAFRRVLGRVPAPADAALLGRAYERQLAVYQSDPAAADAVCKAGNAPAASCADRPAQAALAAVCLALLNLDEALCRE